MASKKTTHYQLSQYEATDLILRADVNADNAKIDNALHAHDDSLQAIQTELSGGGRITRITFGHYVGDGQYGPDHKNTLQFDFTPVFVMISENDNQDKSPMLRGSTVTNSTYGNAINLSWTDNSVSWWCDSGVTNPHLAQNNSNNRDYYWVALGYADHGT